MIHIGKKWDSKAQYIGRGSPLGNPFVIGKHGDRDRVCDLYQLWFDGKVAAKDEVVMRELRRLYRLAREGELVLGCFCAPNRCHGETIKSFLEKHLP